MDAPRQTKNRAKQLRQDQTPPEGILWSKLRARRLDGLKFRRQHPMGPYVADFYCDEAKLIVEVDGASHGPRKERDNRRDAYFEEQGVATLRVPASEIPKNLDGVLRTVAFRARDRIATKS